MVSPSATATEREKKGIPRFALREPSIGSTTIRSRPSPWSSPTSSETIVAPSIASSRSRITRSAAASMAVVSSPPTPAPTTSSRSSLVGRSRRTTRTSSTAWRQTVSHSVKGIEQEAGRQLREEVRRLLRHDLAAPSEREDAVERRRRDEDRGLRLARIDAGDCLPRVGGVGDIGEVEAVDVLDRRLVQVRLRVIDAEAAVVDRVGGTGHGRQHLERIFEPERVLVRLARQLAGDVRDEPVRREDRQPLLMRRHEHDHHPGARLGAVLRVKRERRLVAVVSVRDQELIDLRQLAPPPEPVTADLEVGLARGKRDARSVVEQENRLELRPSRPQKTQPALLRARVRALVGQNDPLLIRLDPERDDDAVADALDTVRADEPLREGPRHLFGVTHEHASLAPIGKVARGF